MTRFDKAEQEKHSQIRVTLNDFNPQRFSRQHNLEEGQTIL